MLREPQKKEGHGENKSLWPSSFLSGSLCNLQTTFDRIFPCICRTVVFAYRQDSLFHL